MVLAQNLDIVTPMAQGRPKAMDQNNRGVARRDCARLGRSAEAVAYPPASPAPVSLAAEARLSLGGSGEGKGVLRRVEGWMTVWGHQGWGGHRRRIHRSSLQCATGDSLRLDAGGFTSVPPSIPGESDLYGPAWRSPSKRWGRGPIQNRGHLSIGECCPGNLQRSQSRAVPWDGPWLLLGWCVWSAKIDRSRCTSLTASPW